MFSQRSFYILHFTLNHHEHLQRHWPVSSDDQRHVLQARERKDVLERIHASMF